MNHTMTLRLMGLFIVAPGLLVLAGCDSTGHAKFTPTKDEARSCARGGLDRLA